MILKLVVIIGQVLRVRMVTVKLDIMEKWYLYTA